MDIKEIVEKLKDMGFDKYTSEKAVYKINEKTIDKAVG